MQIFRQKNEEEILIFGFQNSETRKRRNFAQKKPRQKHKVDDEEKLTYKMKQLEQSYCP